MKQDVTKYIDGCGTALITPFTKKGSVDYKTFKKLVIRQIEGGINFLVPLGTTGETPCLTQEEKEKIFSIAKEEASKAKRTIPVIVGAGGNCTAEVVNNVKVWSKLGADALLIVTPYYNKPTQEGLYQHFTEVAKNSSAPIILYNVPGRTGINLTADTTLKLAKNKNIIAVKEASGNYEQINKIINNAPKGFKVFSGNDDETLNLVCTGANGVISVASNIVPNEMVNLVDFIKHGKLDEARKIHKQLSPLFKNCFIESNPIPCKAAMNIMGLIENVLRLPLTPAKAETVKIMQETLKALNL